MYYPMIKSTHSSICQKMDLRLAISASLALHIDRRAACKEVYNLTFRSRVAFYGCHTVSLLIGIYPVPPVTVGRILVHLVVPFSEPHWTQPEVIVVAGIRLPRVVLAALAGMGLGLAGGTLQGLFRNPLVGPDIIGISAGAAFGAVLGIAFSLPELATVGMAFAGGMIALGAAAGIAALGGSAGILSVVLAGVIVSAFFSGLVGIMQYFVSAETQLPGIVYWLMGSFAAADRAKVLLLAGPVIEN